MDSMMDTMPQLKMKEFDWRAQASCDEDIMPSTEQILGSEYNFEKYNIFQS